MRGSAGGGSGPYGGSALCLRYVLLLFAGERSSSLLSLTIVWRLVIACKAFIKRLTLTLSIPSVGTQLTVCFPVRLYAQADIPCHSLMATLKHSCISKSADSNPATTCYCTCTVQFQIATEPSISLDEVVPSVQLLHPARKVALSAILMPAPCHLLLVPLSWHRH